MTTSPSLAATRARGDAGWLFAAPFRPLFVGAALLAALTVPIWIWLYISGVAEVAGMSALAWHSHEMVFGFLPAVMAGYLLSSTPNWSGRLPASGRPLALLFLLWLAGRIVPLVAPSGVGLIVDLAFPLTITAVLFREACIKAPRQSRHGLMLFPLIAAASAAHRLLAADFEAATLLARIGIAIAVLLISAVGGRLIPSLTRNTLAGAGAERIPEPYGRFDTFVLMAAPVGLVCWVVMPTHPVTAVTMGLLAALQLVRLARWRGWLVRRFDVLALHAGYLWVVVGTIFAVLAAEPLEFIPLDAALHALTAGAIGTMTMAVMARLSLTRGVGRGGIERACQAGLVAVSLGALVRVLAPLLPSLHLPLLATSAVLWSCAWLLFLVGQVGGKRAMAR